MAHLSFDPSGFAIPPLSRAATSTKLNGTLVPERGTRGRNALIGFLIAGLYSVFYLLALDNGITPGALATLLGVQPILTIFLTERRVTAPRLGEFRGSWDAGFVLPVLWLALVISVGTTFLLYRLIARGNLVNVTSLFYLVPGVTAALDWVILGNPKSVPMLAGLGLVVAGLLIVIRSKVA
jgi:drug/metabolite transporter (DMT)-like permease